MMPFENLPNRIAEYDAGICQDCGLESEDCDCEMDIPKELEPMIEIMLENGRAVSQVDTTYIGQVKRKMRRIERLLYYLEWYHRLWTQNRTSTHCQHYWLMQLKTYSKLRDLGHAISDVSCQIYEHEI